MIGSIAHVGVTVRSMEASIKFYQDILGLTLTGDMMMEGEAGETLTGIKGAKLRVVYFNSSDDLQTVPLELIEFISISKIKGFASFLVHNTLTSLIKGMAKVKQFIFMIIIILY